MTKNNKKGFTIIEVVLVLAIAGLIFLMVFIALPALQRSQRNTRRRQDMARILSAFNDYQANNNGKMPGTSGSNRETQMDNFVQKYIGATGQKAITNGLADSAKVCKGEEFCDPDGSAYGFFSLPEMGTAKTNVFPNNDSVLKFENHYIQYFYKANCGEEENSITVGSGNNEIAILYLLEGGSVYCGDNQ